MDKLTQRQIDGIMEFLKSYSFRDEDEVYTNGSELVQLFRVEQALENYADGQVLLLCAGG